ncbi:MAG: hypothetical protein JJV97_01075 [SAR324 cluster bacterium]|nr:hypothetical protein [SAR324 cluster bacterium]
MRFLELLNLLFTRLRNFLLKKRKLVFAAAGVIFLLISASGAGVFYYFEQQKKSANQFYSLAVNDSKILEDEKDQKYLTDYLTFTENQGSINKYLSSASAQFFKIYASTISLKNALTNDEKEKAQEILKSLNYDIKDDLLANFIALEKSKTYLKLKKYDAATEQSAYIDYKLMEDMQLLISARIELSKGNNNLALQHLDSLINDFPQSPLVAIAQNYQHTID